MDRAVDDREVVLVRRRSGEAVAMIAADGLQNLMETAHLLRSSCNAVRLIAALSRVCAGEAGLAMSADAFERHCGFAAVKARALGA